VQTLQSVLLYGDYEWRPELLPRAEFERRLGEARRLMRENDWDKLLVYGDSRENAALCYFTNIVPNQRWSLLLVGIERDPRVVASVGPRDIPSIKRLTWVDDILASSDAKAALSEWLRESGSSNGPGRIAIAGLAQMRARIGGDIVSACGGPGGVVDATDALVAIRRVKSPAELSLLRKSYSLLQDAFAEVEDRRKAGSGIAAAVIAAEKAARHAGAQDVRSLCRSGRARPLAPVAGASDAEAGAPWSVYLAVRCCGYWTEGLTTLPFARCEAVAAMRDLVGKASAHVKQGLPFAQWQHDCGSPDTKSGRARTSLSARAHGLSLDAEPWLASQSGDVFAAPGAFMILGRATSAEGDEIMESATVFFDDAGRSELRPLRRGSTA